VGIILKSQSELEIPSAEFRFAKHILVVGIILLPLLAIIDYKSDYLIPTLAKIISAFICVIGLFFIRNIRFEKYVRLCIAVVILIMSLTGAYYKQDSYYSLIWVPVLPVLFAFLVGVIPGIVLSFIYLCFYSFCYYFFASFHASQPVDIQVWLTSVLAFMLTLLVSTFFKLEKQKDELDIRTAAELDYLTRVPNRHGFMPRLNNEIHRVNRYDSDLSLMLIDIDHFKRINDEYGHPAGDQLLIEFSALLVSRLRSSDIVARWGGEEFIVLTPETDIRACTDLAETLRASVAETLRASVAEHSFANIGKVTASFGATQYIQPETEQAFISRADELLYLAKKRGRNKVEFSHSKYLANKTCQNVNSVA